MVDRAEQDRLVLLIVVPMVIVSIIGTSLSCIVF